MPSKSTKSTGKSLGDILASSKPNNPIKSLVKSGMAIKMLVGDNEKIKNIMNEVQTRNSGITKSNQISQISDESSQDLASLQSILLDKVTQTKETLMV